MTPAAPFPVQQDVDVVSSGFAEAGPEGRQRQAELLDVCRRAGMRLIGPN